MTLISFTPTRIAEESSLVDEVLEQTNKFRKSKGLEPLEMKKDLNKIAEEHSKDMAKGDRSFGHGGFNKREKEVQDVIKDYTGMAENVAYGKKTAKEVVEMWKSSSQHRSNLLGPYKYIGIGTAKNKKGQTYFTQIFVK